MDYDKKNGMKCLEYFDYNVYWVEHGYAFGGPNALSEKARDAVRDIVGSYA